MVTIRLRKRTEQQAAERAAVQEQPSLHQSLVGDRSKSAAAGTLRFVTRRSRGAAEEAAANLHQGHHPPVVGRRRRGIWTPVRRTGDVTLHSSLGEAATPPPPFVSSFGGEQSQ